MAMSDDKKEYAVINRRRARTSVQFMKTSLAGGGSPFSEDNSDYQEQVRQVLLQNLPNAKKKQEENQDLSIILEGCSNEESPIVVNELPQNMPSD